jgi:acyl-CoA hydrolase
MAVSEKDYEKLYAEKMRTVQECLEIIRSGDVVVAMADNNEPEGILKEFHTIAPRVENVILQKGANGMFRAVTEPGMDGRINSTGYYFGAAHRAGNKLGNSSYVACDIPDFEPFFGSVHPCTVFMASVTPMDENGNFCAGLCRQWGDEFIKMADRVILEVNPNLPPMRRGLMLNIRDVTCLYEAAHDLWDLPTIEATAAERQVAQNCRALLRDGDCIQLGIGGLPNAIAESMDDLRDLGIHSEMFTAAMGAMVRRGIVTGERKNFHPNEHIGSFAGGDMALYKTLAENPKCRILPGAWVVDPMIIKQNDNMVSINTAIEMDLTGQITAESVGPMQMSGTGGAFDFAYGALHSKGGRGIYAFTSTSKKGFSKINCLLKEGAQVSIPRNYADYIVTEFGIAPLRGRTTRERAENLIAVAHPDFRAPLRQQARELNII